MFLAGSDSEAEDDYYTSASAASSKSAASSSVLSSSDAARIAVHCNLRRVSREPPWLAALVARRAEQEAETAAIEEAARQTPATTAVSPPAARADATRGGVQPRRRRNSLSDALRVLLPGDRSFADEVGGEAGEGDDGSTVSASASTREVLYGALRDAGFGRELSVDDTVVVGGDRVPRTLCKLGDALRKAGGIDEPRIFAQRPAFEEMLEVVRQLRLAEVPALPRADSPNGVQHDPRDSRVSGRPHAIAALIKEWLLQLPGGLLQLSDAHLAEVYGAKEPLVPTRVRLDEMRGTLCGDAWHWFVRLLAEIQQSSPRNNMPARELAIVLAPLVARAKAPHVSAPAGGGTEASDHSTSTVDDCEREMHVMRFVQHCVAVMARKQLSLVRSPQANRRAMRLRQPQ
eukprot:COSAG02_NODE_13479_length_1389_cov_1.857364_1_plen_402_part_10